MATATVTGTIKEPDGTAWASAVVKFQITDVGAVSGGDVFPRKPVSVTTDTNGDFSTTLWVNGDSGITSYYRVTLPSGETRVVSIPTGTTTIDLDALLVTYQISNPVVSSFPLSIAQGGTSSTSASAARTALGLAIGTDVQAYDADLAAIAALAKTDGNIIVGNGSAWVAESGATARTSLGLGTGDAPQFATGVVIGNLTLANGSITDSSGTIDFGNEDLTTSGTLTVGTGGVACTAGDLFLSAQDNTTVQLDLNNTAAGTEYFKIITGPATNTELFKVLHTGAISNKGGTFDIDASGNIDCEGYMNLGSVSSAATTGEFSCSGDISGSAGLNLGTGTGAGVGEIDMSGSLYLNGSWLRECGRIYPNTGSFYIDLGTANTLKAYSGGVQIIQMDADATSGNTRLMIYDVDNATLERVSVGAADSGGAGYKVLRIPN